MAMKKLQNSIQSVFSASTQINSYKKAIEELICNSLDAEALSIAIRVNIEQNTIQVIDNGCGVSKSNFLLLGQRYTTSRCVDLEVLKSAPNKYGFRGQSLASIIEVSQNVTITSRCENVDETWVKVFYKGKETELFKTTQRPSKGTTVEIKGFLYNLNIQKRAINPLNELNDIKSFLEQLSLVHSNISLSLRDEPKNEIVFKLHKNRDIYQTLSSLFGVEKKDVKELKVEKNLYKVTAYIGKNKDPNHQHWIYLNGKLVHNSKLHKVVTDNLTKALGFRFNQSKRKMKSKNAYYEEENVSSNNKIPFYFIFINCPYYDYDVIYGPKESVVEFKNWESVNKLLEKLIKFYIGDMNLKEVAKPIQNKQQSKEKEAETRDQVKKIMERILKSNPKKLGVSQMQNGIRGKLIKRKTKKKPLKLTLTKIIPPKAKEGMVAKKTDDIRKNDNADLKNHEDDSIILQQNGTHLDCNDIEINKPIENVEKRKTVAIMEEKKHEKLQKKKNKNVTDTSDKKTEQYEPKINIIISRKPKKAVKNEKQKIYKIIPTKKPQKSKQIVRKGSKKIKKVQDPLISNFQKATASIKQRCNMLATKVDELMTYKDKPKRQVFINETVQYSSVIRNNKNVSIRKKVGEVIIHDYVPLPPKFNACSFDYRVWDRLRTKTYVSTYDLVHTILKSQQKDNIFNDDIKTPCKTPKTATERIHYEPVSTEADSPKIPEFARETYESHNYTEVRNSLRENNDFDSHSKKPRNKQFITKQSRDNFITARDRANIRYKPITGRKKTCGERPALFSMFNLIDKESNNHTPYTIEFSNSNEKKINEEKIVTNGLVLFRNQNKNGTCTIEKDNELTHFLPPSKIGGTYTITATEKSQRIDSEDPQIHACSIENVDWYCSHRSINVQQSTSIFFTQRYVKNISSMGNEGQDSEKENVDKKHSVASVELRHDNIEVPNNTVIEPLNVCETILCSHDNKRNSNNPSWNDSLINNLFEDSNGRCSDSLFNNEFDINSLLCDRNVYSNMCEESQVMEGLNKLKQLNDPPNPDPCSKNVIELDRNNRNNYKYSEQHIPYSKENNVTKLAEQTKNIKIPTINRQNGTKDKRIDNQTNHFTFKNRHRFVPKGMSPIFENCQSKYECDYNPNNDYYEKTLYNNFANNVQINSEIFEPRVQNVNELTTRDIEKVNIRLIKDNASLKFNGDTLKHANVLGQVDDKFIAAKMKGKSHQSQDLSEFLVLFDQHAVHERIRLENNLKDYLQDDKWKSITLDDIPLKLSKDEILYLHNYKDKFTQFGLHWTVLNNSEVSIHAIPEAVLGKNPRQVEVVIKAVRNLISEEIHAMKSQKGCVTLYPKSIMDLVFSEACRYAIKFGDKLSKRACMDLLSALSECKTPFQCAHGRPVMAVVMEVKSERRKYELTLPEVHKFAQCSKKRIE